MSQPPARPQQSITLPDEPPSEPLTPQQARDRSIYLRNTLKKIEQYQNAGVTPDEIALRVPEFKKDFPKLFATLFDTNGYHKQSLQTMLFMLERMGNGQLTQHNASMIVGQRVFDTFVKPQVDAMPPDAHPPS